MKTLIKILIFLLLVIILLGIVFLRSKQEPVPEPEPENNVSDSVGPSSDEPSELSPGEDVPSEGLAADDTEQGPPSGSEQPAEPGSNPAPEPEPTPELFTISVIGDETLTSHQNLSNQSEYSYNGRMNGDYSYPFKNTAEYFLNDEYTISNLECTLADQQMYSDQTFYFRAPTANAQVLTEGGVDFVTTANNHSLDFGQAGLISTYAALEEYGIAYGKEDESQIITTKNGMKIGIYCAYNSFQPNKDKACSAIQMMRPDADYIICCFHWGQELHYQPNADQIDLARACIDAGADLIFGCHSHCLQPIEEYNGGIILYSMGEFSFGGSTSPTDRDTAIFQVTLKRDLDGSITVDSWRVIPCCVSSRPVYEGYTLDAYNDYCPTPYEEGSEDYERVMSKLNGTYEGGNVGADYSNWYNSYS